MRFFVGMLGNDLRFNRGRLVLLAFIIMASLFTHVALGAILAEMQAEAVALWRASPYDISVAGSDLDAGVAGTIPGVMRAESALSTEAILGSSQTTFLSLKPGQRTFALAIAAGALPQGAGEIALPAQLASALNVGPGDSVSILPSALSQSNLRLTVCGVFEDKLGTPACPIVTEECIKSITVASSQVLLVTLDGAADIDGVTKEIAKAFPSATIKAARDQYEGVQQGGGLATQLVAAIRGLVLIITSVALGALILLVQRQRSFEFGLLKAMGASSAWVIVPACLNVLLAFVVSAPLTWLALLGARPLLRTPRLNVLFANWVSSSMLFAGLGLVIALLVTVALTSREASALLNDSWGRG